MTSLIFPIFLLVIAIPFALGYFLIRAISKKANRYIDSKIQQINTNNKA